MVVEGDVPKLQWVNKFHLSFSSSACVRRLNVHVCELIQPRSRKSSAIYTLNVIFQQIPQEKGRFTVGSTIRWRRGSGVVVWRCSTEKDDVIMTKSTLKVTANWRRGDGCQVVWLMLPAIPAA